MARSWRSSLSLARNALVGLSRSQRVATRCWTLHPTIMSSPSLNKKPTVNGANASPQTNGASASTKADLATLQLVIEQSADVPDDATDADIAGLLRALEQADGVGRDVEGRLDAILAQLDGMLGALEPNIAAPSTETAASTAKAEGGQDKGKTE